MLNAQLEEEIETSGGGAGEGPVVLSLGILFGLAPTLCNFIIQDGGIEYSYPLSYPLKIRLLCRLPSTRLSCNHFKLKLEVLVKV